MKSILILQESHGRMGPTTTTFKCNLCSFSAPHKYRVKDHKNAVHLALRPWICEFPGCGLRFKTKAVLLNHKRLHETVLELRKPYPCTFKGCEYRATLKSTRDDHMLAAHAPGRAKDFQCPLCPSKYHTKGLLKFRIPCHTNEKRFKCKQRKFETGSFAILQRHVKNMHQERAKYTCDTLGCNYSVLQRASYMIHRQTHNPDPLVRRPFPCSFLNCNYRAPTKPVLKSHRKTHDPHRSRGCHCPLCPKAFFTRGELKSHIVFCHTREKHYSWDKCAYVTGFRGNLRRHCRSMHQQREQPLEKKFKCEFCDYCANRQSHIRSHSRQHEKDLQKRFPVPCTFPDCDFRAGMQLQVKKHERRHYQNPQAQLRCKLCPMVYPDRASWNFHNLQFHAVKLRHYRSKRSAGLDKTAFVLLERICLELI